jgi:hypothetical protein
MLDRLQELEAKVQFLMGLPCIAKDLADKRQAELEAREAQKADEEAADQDEEATDQPVTV